MLARLISAFCLLALRTDGAAVPNFPSVTAGARSSQIARCTDGEILISFSKRGFYNNQTNSREYILNPICAPFENPRCFKECKWASWCKATGYQPTKTVVTGVGMRNYGPPYGHMILLYCCEMASTKIVDCEFKEESEMFGADVGLFAETNKRNQLNGPAVIRDVFSKKDKGDLALRVEMCGVQRADTTCITNAPVPHTGPFELITSPPEIIDNFFENTDVGQSPDSTRIRQGGTVQQIFGFEPDAVDPVSDGLPPPPPALPAASQAATAQQIPAPFGPAPAPQPFVAPVPPTRAPRPRPTRAPRPPRIPWWQRTRRPRPPPRTRRPRPPPRPRWTPRPRPPPRRPRPLPPPPRPRPLPPTPRRPPPGNPHQQFGGGRELGNLPEPPPPPPPPPPRPRRPPPPTLREGRPPPPPSRPRNVNPSQVFRECCSRYSVITPRCITMCTYDNFSKQSLIQSYLQKKCPSNAKDPLLGCASSFTDHSRCCASQGIASFRRGLCMPFCNPSRGLPQLGIKFLPCLNHIEKIAGCFKGHIIRTQG